MGIPLGKYEEFPIDVTTTSQEILAANPRRKYAILINNSNQNIFVRLGSPATVDEGIVIWAAGFAYEFTEDNLWVGSIHAIHGGSGNKRLLIIEMS